MIPLIAACLAFMLLSAGKRGLLLHGDRLVRAHLRELRLESTPTSYAQLVETSTHLLDVACVQACQALSAPGHEAEAPVALDVVRYQMQVLGDNLHERWRAWNATAALLPAAVPVAPLRASALRLPWLRALAFVDGLARPLLTPPLGLRLHLGLLRLGLTLACRDLAHSAAPTRLIDAAADFATLARASVPVYDALLRAPAQPLILGLQGSRPS